MTHTYYNQKLYANEAVSRSDRPDVLLEEKQFGPRGIGAGGYRVGEVYDCDYSYIVFNINVMNVIFDKMCSAPWRNSNQAFPNRNITCLFD